MKANWKDGVGMLFKTITTKLIICSINDVQEMIGAVKALSAILE